MLNQHLAGEFVNGYKLIQNIGPNKKGRTVFLVECNNCKSNLTAVPSLLKGKSCQNCLGRKKGRSGLLRLYNDYQRSAKNRNLKFELTLEEFEKLTSSICHYCASNPSNKRKGGGNYTRKDKKLNSWFIYNYNGVDRMNNDTGYTITNCVSCCTICNCAKKKLSYESFLIWIEKLIKNDLPKVNKIC
jgi:hypothetical protein